MKIKNAVMFDCYKSCAEEKHADIEIPLTKAGISVYLWQRAAVELNTCAAMAVNQIRSSDLAIIWNGNEPGCQWFIQQCQESGTPHVTIERGLFPQENNYLFDPFGVGAKSGIMGGNTTDERTNARSVAKAAIGNIAHQGGKKTLVVLQLMYDTSVYPATFCKTEDDFIAQMASIYGEDNLLIAPHPRNKSFKSIRYPNIPVVNDTLLASQYCKRAVAISSTALYIIAATGCPVVPYARTSDNARHPLDRGFELDDVLATIIKRQFKSGDNGETIIRAAQEAIYGPSWRP